MNSLRFLLIFAVIAGFSIVGCSDRSASPVSPADQVNLEKAVITNFTFTDYPIAAPTGGKITLTPGGIWQVKKIEVTERFEASDPMADGIMVHQLSLSIDAETGEGPCHGSWILTPIDPAATGGGVWVGTYQGYRSLSDIPGEWILPLKVIGHGKGGTINGMQTNASGILIVRADGPTTLPTSWVGTGEGFFKSH